MHPTKDACPLSIVKSEFQGYNVLICLSMIGGYESFNVSHLILRAHSRKEGMDKEGMKKMYDPKYLGYLDNAFEKKPSYGHGYSKETNKREPFYGGLYESADDSHEKGYKHISYSGPESHEEGYKHISYSRPESDEEWSDEEW